MMNATNQAALIASKFAAQAVGELYRELGFIRRTNVWKTDKIQENGNFEVPVIGQNLVANDRDGSGNTVDQTPDADTVSIPLTEKHVSFPIDLNWFASENGQMTVKKNLSSAIKVLAKKVHTDAFQTMATTSGLAATGTLGSALVKADWDFARRTLVENDADYGNFTALISPRGMGDLTSITEFAEYNANGVPGVFSEGAVAKANNFVILETPRLYNPSGSQIVGLAGDFSGVYTVFPKQYLFNEGSNFKVEDEFDGIRFTILQEYVPGKGGAWRWVVMATYGVAIADDRLVIKLNGR